jgi:hypothetical protein
MLKTKKQACLSSEGSDILNAKKDSLDVVSLLRFHGVPGPVRSGWITGGK